MPIQRSIPVACPGRMIGRRVVGFTLIELLVTLTIILVVAGILLVCLNIFRGVTRRLQCMGNQQQYGNALLQFIHAHGGEIPCKNNLKYGRLLGRRDWPLKPYLDAEVAANLEDTNWANRKVLRCPEVHGYFTKNYATYFVPKFPIVYHSGFSFNNAIVDYPMDYEHTGSGAITAAMTANNLYNLRQMKSQADMGIIFCGARNWNNYNNDMEGAAPGLVHFPHGYTDDDTSATPPRLVGGKANVWYLDGHVHSLKERVITSATWTDFNERQEMVRYTSLPAAVTSTSPQYAAQAKYYAFWGLGPNGTGSFTSY